MKIALDYDDTYTLNRALWLDFINLLKLYPDTDIRIVTIRHPQLDKITDGLLDIPIIYTSGMAKKWYLINHGDWSPDVWIEDRPELILENSAKDREWLKHWRATR